MNGIHGMIFRPMAIDNNHDEVLAGSDYSVRSGFLEKYQEHIGGMQVVAMSAKTFIEKNWKQVADWSDLNVVVESSNQEPVEFFKYEKRERIGKSSRVWEEMQERRDKRDQERHNPITEVKDVVLDVDWDFSMTINGKEYWWLSDDTVVIIASFIEKQIAK
jgi:hypothetical protein